MNYEMSNTDTVSFKNGICVHTMSNKDLGETIDENILLKDAILMILNPEYCKDADLYFNDIIIAKEWVNSVLTGYNKEFVSNVFNGG